MVDGGPRMNLAAVDAATGTLDPLHADVTGGTTVQVRTLLAGSDKVLPRRHLQSRERQGPAPNGGHPCGWHGRQDVEAESQGDRAQPVLWTIRTSGNVQTVAVRGTRVLFGGHFSQIDATDQSNVKRTRFAAVNFAGQVDPWAPAFAGTFWGPWDILSTGDQVYVGGDFLTVSAVGQQNIARFTDTP
jgi:hypothetical protein